MRIGVEVGLRRVGVVCAAVVLIVRGYVHLYRLWYMRGDPHGPRFFGLIARFTGFMLVLLRGRGVAMMFLG